MGNQNSKKGTEVWRAKREDVGSRVLHPSSLVDFEPHCLAEGSGYGFEMKRASCDINDYKTLFF